MFMIPTRNETTATVGLEVSHFLNCRNHATLPSLEDLLFYTVAEGEETLPVHKFLAVSSIILLFYFYYFFLNSYNSRWSELFVSWHITHFEQAFPQMSWLYYLTLFNLQALKETGLRTGDPRLKECMEALKEAVMNTEDGITLDKHMFKK